MRQFVIVLGITLLAIGARSLAAEATAGDSLAKQVLQVGWDRSLSSLKQAEKLAAGAEGASQVDRALMLVYVRHSRFDRAAAMAERLAKIDSASVLDLRNLAWLRMVSKEYSGAAGTLADLANQLEDADDNVDQVELAAFLGRQMGYLSGPVRSELTLSQRERAQRKINGALSDEHRSIAVSSTEAVLEEFRQLTSDKSISANRAQLKAEEERIRTLDDLGKQRVALSEQIGRLEAQRSQITSQAAAQRGALESQQQTAFAELSAAQREYAIRQMRLNRVLDDIRFFELRLSQEEDPFLREQTFADLRRAEVIASRFGAEVRESVLLVNAAASRKVDLDRQIAVLLNREAAELASVDRNLNTARRRDTSFANQESRARRTLDPKMGASRSLGDQATALTTYDAFPLESERERFLADLE